MHRLPRARPDYCKPHSGKPCRTRSRDREPPLDTDGKKTMFWQSVDLDFEHGAPSNLCFVLTLLLMKTVILGKTKMNQAEGYVIIGVRFSKHAPKVRGITNMKISCDMFDDIRWVIDKNEFDELMASKKESAPGPDGIPYSFYR